MSIFTLNQLAEALGPMFHLVPMGDEQARVLFGGGDIAYIDFADQSVETDIRVTGFAADERPNPTDAAAVVGTVREEWEYAGFEVDHEGTIGSHWYPADPGKQFPHVGFTAHQSFNDLGTAVRILQWLRDANTMLEKR